MTGHLLSAIGKNDREIRRTRTRVGDGESRLENLVTICPDPSVIADLHSDTKSLTNISNIVIERVAAHHDALAERATDVDFLSSQLEVLAIDAASEVSLGEIRGNVNLLTKHVKDISRRLGVGLGKIKQVSHLAKTSKITFSAGITSLWDYCRALKVVNKEQWRQIDEKVNSTCRIQSRRTMDISEQKDKVRQLTFSQPSSTLGLTKADWAQTMLTWLKLVARQEQVKHPAREKKNPELLFSSLKKAASELSRVPVRSSQRETSQSGQG